MAGLYIKELMLRGDVERCLIVAPGGLVEQWQDELAAQVRPRASRSSRREPIDVAPAANVFEQKHLLIARLDQLARNEDLLAQARANRLGPRRRRRGAPDVARTGSATR